MWLVSLVERLHSLGLGGSAEQTGRYALSTRMCNLNEETDAVLKFAGRQQSSRGRPAADSVLEGLI